LKEELSMDEKKDLLNRNWCVCPYCGEKNPGKLLKRDDQGIFLLVCVVCFKFWGVLPISAIPKKVEPNFDLVQFEKLIEKTKSKNP